MAIPHPRRSAEGAAGPIGTNRARPTYQGGSDAIGEMERRSPQMARIGWYNGFTGDRLDGTQLTLLRERAHRLYEANVHIFEDEAEALAALGVVTFDEMLHPGVAVML